jgi:hypothetical protein
MTSTSLRDYFVRRVEIYCAANGISEDRLGRLACGGDHHAVPNLRRGRATLRRLEQIEAFLQAKFVPAEKGA